MPKSRNGGDDSSMFRTLYDVVPNSKYIVEATGEFLVCDVDVDGRTCGVLGPARAGYRRFLFVSRGSRIAVVCEAPGTWHRLIDVRLSVGAEDPTDPVPTRLPVPRNKQPDIRQMVREEIVGLLRRREEIDFGRALTPEERMRDETDFDIDDYPDEAPDSMFQVEEMPFDEDIVMRGGVDESRRQSDEDSEGSASEGASEASSAESGAGAARSEAGDEVPSGRASRGRRARRSASGEAVDDPLT